MLSLASNLPALWFFTWQDYGPRSSWAPFASPLLYPGSQVRRDNSGTEAVRGFGSRQKSQPDDGSMHPESLISRRLCVGASVCFFATKAPAAYAAKRGAGDWSSPGLAAAEDPSLPKFVAELPGVKVQELSAGSGAAAAREGDTVVLNYVMRRANGYFIYSTVQGVSFQPKDIPTEPLEFELAGFRQKALTSLQLYAAMLSLWLTSGTDLQGQENVIPGLQTAVTGMHVGAKRRAVIYPPAGYENRPAAEPQPPGFAAKRQLLNHSREPLLFELQLLRIRQRPLGTQ